MPEIGPLEILVVAAVALVFLGPERLPRYARTAGRWMNEMRRMASEVRDEFQSGLDDEEVEDEKPTGADDKRTEDEKPAEDEKRAGADAAPPVAHGVAPGGEPTPTPED